MDFRPYDPARDVDAVRRIWRECGWITDDAELPAVDALFRVGRKLVAEVDGAAECFVMTGPGRMRYLRDDMPSSLVYAVTTSRVVRRQGLAGRLTARAIAADAAGGAEVALLGMFEQGYYDRLGFGSGGYDHYLEFDPGRLRLPAGVRPRPSRRLTVDDAEIVHANRLARRRGHGACNFPETDDTRAEMSGSKDGFGIGFFDGPGGTLSHHLWCRAGGPGLSGPYRVRWLAYQTDAQLLDLLATIASWADQVRLVRLVEPAGVQLQDLLVEPWKGRRTTERSDFAQTQWMHAFWQARMCDVPACLGRTRLPGGDLRFNVTLTDPIARFLSDDAPWRGVAGDYVVSLGSASGAERGRDPDRPTLEASVGAFTRLWIGARPATGLAVTDDLRGPRELLETLDDVLRLPPPHPDWEL